MEEKGKKKRKKKYIPYDYEAAYTKSMDDLHEWFASQMLSSVKGRGKSRTIYALKEIKAGSQFEVEIYPQFNNIADIPEEGRRIVKDNSRAQRNLNDKNARKYLERLINENFGTGDIWITLTYDDEHLPADGDFDAALKDVQLFFNRINYRRKKKGLPNAKYVYITAYDSGEEIRWHHHIIMDGALDMDTVESCWGQSSRNEVRRIQEDEDGLSGLANYIIKQKDRLKSEKRWRSSRGLKKPDIKVVHSKQPEKGRGNYKPIATYIDGMIRDRDTIRTVLSKWYPHLDFTDAEVYYNDFNCMFYIHARMREKRKTDGAETGKKT